MTECTEIRSAHTGDVPEIRAILNEIIGIGGTTAFEEPLSEDAVSRLVLTRPELLFAHVALDSANTVAGFQYVVSLDAPGMGSIATFARQRPAVRGIGTALFDTTLAAARRSGLSEIEAKIRADNVSGLADYTKMGFQDHSVVKGVPLKDGTPLDRIIKRYQLV